MMSIVARRTNVVVSCVLGLALVAVLGCAGKKVMVPPRVDLNAYSKIGMVEFSSNAEGNLSQFASQKFLEAVQSSQPGVRVIELGSRERVLQSIERDQFDFDAVQAIGERYNVDAVIIGDVEVTDVKPRVDLSSILSTMSVSADVEASLTARLYEAESGATLWTNSARGKEVVGHVGVSTNGPTHFGATDPEDAYGKLVYGLVYRVTEDFRVQYVRQ
jgi:hypothetical protein